MEISITLTVFYEARKLSLGFGPNTAQGRIGVPFWPKTESQAGNAGHDKVALWGMGCLFLAARGQSGGTAL